MCIDRGSWKDPVLMVTVCQGTSKDWKCGCQEFVSSWTGYFKDRTGIDNNLKFCKFSFFTYSTNKGVFLMESLCNAVCFFLDWLRQNDFHVDVTFRSTPKAEVRGRGTSQNSGEGPEEFPDIPE